MRKIAILILLTLLFMSCKKKNSVTNSVEPVIRTNCLENALKLQIDNLDSLAADYRESDYPFVVYNGVPVETVFIDSIAFASRNDSIVFHPLLSAICVITLYTRYLENHDESDKKILLKNLDYLEDSLTDEFYCEYNFAINSSIHPMQAPWISGLAQGELCTAFCRGYFLTGEQKYLDIAGKILETLIYNGEDYWCVYTDDDNYYWIEEYPGPEKLHVLNGIMFALWGVWEYYTVTEDENARDVLLAGLKTIADHCCTLWYDETLRYSKYCIKSEASASYHRVHIKQFKTFYDQFKIPEFNEAYELFYNMYYIYRK